MAIMRTALVVLLALARPVFADDELEARPQWDAALGTRSGVMHVGDWRAMDIGFEGYLGVRFDRFELLAEGDLAALWPANWSRGEVLVTENHAVSGSMQRLGVDLRYSFLRQIGSWTKHHERLVNHLYVEAGLGDQRVAIDGLPSYGRRDVELGLGYLMFARMRGGGHLAGQYAIRASWADGAATPGTLHYMPAAPGTRRDFGVIFELAVAFGN